MLMDSNYLKAKLNVLYGKVGAGKILTISNGKRI